LPDDPRPRTGHLSGYRTPARRTAIMIVVVIVIVIVIDLA
jgi:hypothetical protein